MTEETEKLSLLSQGRYLSPMYTSWFAYRKSSWACGTLLTVVLILAACATVPKYEYTEQKDSASVEIKQVPVDPTFPTFDDAVIISLVDGQSANFPSAFPFDRQRLYLAPGNHTLSLYCWHSSLTIRGDNPPFALRSTVKAYGAIKVEFTAGHVYRWSASLSKETLALFPFAWNPPLFPPSFSKQTFDVTLWDVTGGLTVRRRVGDWQFSGNTTRRYVVNGSE